MVALEQELNELIISTKLHRIQGSEGWHHCPNIQETSRKYQDALIGLYIYV